MHSIKEQVTAFSGMLQAASVAHRIAVFGNIDEDNLATAVKSIFCTSPSKTIDVYENYSNLKNGQQILDAIIKKNTKVLQSNVLKYTLGMYSTTKQLLNNSQILKQISDGLEQIRQLFHLEGALDPILIEKLNTLYLNTISKIKPRIMVVGKQEYLKNTQLSCKIRCALFSGIRSAVLWHQCGGRLWHLIFYRKRIQDGLEQCKQEF